MLFWSSASRLKPSLIPTSFPRGDCYGAASHATPSQIERREFYNGITDTVIKTAALKKSITLPSRSGDALCRWWRRTLKLHNGNTMWLYILSSCGLSRLLLCPTTYSWRYVWRVPIMTAVPFQDTHCPIKLRHITLFPSVSSAWRLPRHTASSQSVSLPLPWCGWSGAKSLPLLCLCSSFPFWHLCRCRNFVLSDGLPTVSQKLPSVTFCLLLLYYGIYYNTIYTKYSFHHSSSLSAILPSVRLTARSYRLFGVIAPFYLYIIPW